MRGLNIFLFLAVPSIHTYLHGCTIVKSGTHRSLYCHGLTLVSSRRPDAAIFSRDTSFRQLNKDRSPAEWMKVGDTTGVAFLWYTVMLQLASAACSVVFLASHGENQVFGWCCSGRNNRTKNDDSEYCLCRGSFLDEAIYHSKLTIAAAALRLCSLSARFVIDATLPFRSLAEK